MPLKCSAKIKLLLSGFIPLVGFILLLSCKTKDYKVYTGYKFEINFFKVGEFDTTDWIEIDGIRFNHYKRKEDFSQPYALPTSKIVRDSLGPDQKFISSFNTISIAIMLGNNINQIEDEKDEKERRQKKYILSDKPLLMTYGKLRFHKADSSLITIKTSKKYPAQVTEMKFN